MIMLWMAPFVPVLPVRLRRLVGVALVLSMAKAAWLVGGVGLAWSMRVPLRAHCMAQRLSVCTVLLYCVQLRVRHRVESQGGGGQAGGGPASAGICYRYL